MSSIGENIRKCRKWVGYTQQELAQKSGFSVMTIRRYESGERQPAKNVLDKLARAMNVNPMQLIDPEKYERDLLTTEIHYSGNEVLYIDDLLKFFEKSLSKMNSKGKSIALERIEELSKIPEYRKDNGDSDAVPDSDEETPAGK